MGRNIPQPAMYLAKPDTAVSLIDDVASVGAVTSENYDPGDVGQVLATSAGICAWDEWSYACIRTANRTGSTNTFDASNRCNTDATIVTNITKSIDIDFLKERDANSGEFPEWFNWLEECYAACTPIYAMMLCDIRENTGSRGWWGICLLYTSPSPRDATLSRMPSSA